MTYRPGSVTVPYPAFEDPAVQAWAESLFGWAQDLQKRVNAILAEARKVKGAALTAADSGTVNSGDATTDDVIEANRTRIGEIEAILVANILGTEA